MKERKNYLNYFRFQFLSNVERSRIGIINNTEYNDVFFF